MLEIRELYKSFDENRVLNGINLKMDIGEVVVILGSSGSGKSTMLRCINYLEKPDSGEISIDGFKVNHENNNQKNIYKIRSMSSMVFQNYNLF